MTEHEFLTRFEASSPRFEELYARVQRADAEIAMMKVLLNPTISFEREQVFPSDQDPPQDYLRLGIPVDVSGRRARRVRAAQAGAEAARADAEHERLLLRLQALDLYDDAALARLQTDALRADRHRLAKLVGDVTARARSGDASGYDRSRLEIELGRYDDLLAQAEIERSALSRTLGHLAGAETPAEASSELPIPAMPMAPDATLEPAAQRADYVAARQRVEQAEQQLSAARRAWIPVLWFTGGWKRSHVGSEDADGYVAGLLLSVPLLDHGQAESERANALRQQAETERRVLAWQVQAAIANAYDELKGRIQEAQQFTDTQLPRLAPLLRCAEMSYREGEQPVLELLDAYRTARESELRALTLRREARRSEVQLWRALGRRPSEREQP